MRQSVFKPFGEKLSEFSFDNRKFQLYKVTEYSHEFDAYFSRIQTLTMFFVECAQYLDTEDTRFMHYFLYEEREDFKTNSLKLAGYMSLYRFYVYPDLERARFAHVLVMPSYRQIGLGPKFLGAIFADIRQSKTIVDTTAEQPAEPFVFMRDYADCVFCKPLPEFSPENFKKGFNKEAMEKVRKEVKICKKQFRRVFEILYLYYVLTECPEEKQNFETSLKRRLALPYKQSTGDSHRLQNALDEKELAIASAMDDSDEKLQQLVDYTLACYNKVVARLRKYEPLFQK